MRKSVFLILTCCALCGAVGPGRAAEVGAAFTYSGQLANGALPVSGTYDFRFVLYGTEVAGAPVASAVERGGVPVIGGGFEVSLDFGAEAFDGDARWLELAVRPTSVVPQAYVRLSPRQPVGAVPYALHAVAGGSGATAGPPGPAGPAGPKGDKGDPGGTWAGIADKPAGFADGVDNDTIRGAGAGLELVPTFGGGTNFAVRFAGSGGLATAARSDHDHDGDTWFMSGQSRVKFDQDSALISAMQTATGSGAHGIIGSAQGGATGVTGASETGRGVAGQSESGTGVIGSSTTGTGVMGVNGFKRGRLGSEEAAVVADAGTSSATAIQVEKGAVRVVGAGLNSNTFVFIHPVTEANYSDYSGTPEMTVIDHPLCNGDPNAILIVTPRYTARLVGGATSFAVWYSGDRWRIRADPMDPGDRFNVMVIKP